MPQTPISSPSPSDPTTRWARDVLSGKIVAGKFTIAAADRHLRDMVDGYKRGLVWRAEAAQHAIDFFPAVLRITAGAKAGQKFDLLPWTLFCTGCLFGWYRESGRLRFRHGWLETGKGQAKSPFMAAVGLYCVGFRGVQRAEGYAIAWDKDQANVPFKDAVAMCRATIPDQEEGDSLESRGAVVIRGALDNAWKIEFPETNSKFQSLANGENISGPRPCFVLADEIHEFKSGEPIELWKSAITKMPGDALMLMGTNTPSTTQVTGTEYSDFYQNIATGEHIDDEAFSFIARVDKTDNPFEDESCWAKSLPALGITFPIENVRGQVNTAKSLLSTAMSIKRLYFGIPLGTTDFWISEEAWLAAQGEVDTDKLGGCPCWLALDLSQKNDFTALTSLWLKNGKFYSKNWYWTPKDSLRDLILSDKRPYDLWIEAGFIIAIDGPVIDKEFIAAQVAELCSEHDVQNLCFDPAGIGDFIRACDDIGFPVWKWQGPTKPKGRGLKLVSHAQGTRVIFEDKQLCMPRSIERLEDKILNGGIVIDASDMTYNCSANAKVVSDAQKNRAFDKKKSRGRIDGIVTLAMAVGSAMADTETAKEPSYQMLFVG